MILADCGPHIHLTAYHAEPGFRSTTPGLGLLCRDQDFILGAGHFQNSIGQHSNYLTAGWQPMKLGPVRLGVVGGVMNGYKYKAGAYFPFAAGVVSIPVQSAEVHLTVIPKVSNLTPLTIGFSTSWKF